jgi:hypothetical protein
MHKTATLDGKSVAFTEQTEFLVEVGRNQGAYRTRYSFKGDLAQAVFYYNAINIGNGYKKRLRAPSMNKPVLARQFS